jgi:hypothetical protein
MPRTRSGEGRKGRPIYWSIEGANSSNSSGVSSRCQGFGPGSDMLLKSLWTSLSGPTTKFSPNLQTGESSIGLDLRINIRQNFHLPTLT